VHALEVRIGFFWCIVHMSCFASRATLNRVSGPFDLVFTHEIFSQEPNEIVVFCKSVLLAYDRRSALDDN